MARAAKKAKEMTVEEKLARALVPESEQPYPVPKNWCWTTIGVINQYNSGSVDPLKEPDSLFELYSVPSSAGNYPEIVHGREIGSTKQAIEKNDVLLCKINPHINRVWYVHRHTDNKLLGSSEWIVIRNASMNSQYLMWCLRSQYFREYMLSNVSGVGGSLMRAQPKFVQGYPIPIAPLPEQQRIVNRIESLFAKLDEAKEKAQAVVDGFEERKAAILHKAFAGELTNEWRKAHTPTINTILNDIKDFSSEWSKKDQSFLYAEQEKAVVRNMSHGHTWVRCTIGAVAQVTNGSTPSRKFPQYWNGSIPWVSSGEVKNNLIDCTEEMIRVCSHYNASTIIAK